MQILNFVQSLQDQNFVMPSVIAISGTQYAPWFVRIIYNRNPEAVIKVLDCSEIDFSFINTQLQMSFLGMHYTYVLLHADSWPASQQHILKKFLSLYAGPHKVILWGKDENFIESHEITYISLHETYDYAQAKQISGLFEHRSLASFAQFLKQVYTQVKKLTMYELALLWQYSKVLGKHQNMFVQEWLPKIMPQEESLFTLSQYYFRKDREKFVHLWNELFEKYSEQFWSVYWAEQLYKAYFYVICMKQKKYTSAKAVSMHLPYSFIKNDWTSYNGTELAEALQAVYQVDYALKNGKHPLLMYNFPLKGIYNQFIS